MTDQPIPSAIPELPPENRTALERIRKEIRNGMSQEQFEQMKQGAEEEVQEMVSAALTMIGFLPPEKRLLGLFIHFCGHSDGAEHGMKIAATVACAISGMSRQQFGLTQHVSVSAVCEYAAAVTQGMTRGFIAKFAPDKKVEDIMDDLAELEKLLFPENAEEIDAAVAEKKAVMKAAASLDDGGQPS